MGIFQKLNTERGITVLLITHERDIAEYGTRIIAFRDGKIVSDEANPTRRMASDELAALPPSDDLGMNAETSPISESPSIDSAPMKSIDPNPAPDLSTQSE
jgi:energy-coupling factor transporter ATP-binding protein EcfA2